MRYQQTTQRRAVILMVVLSLLTLFALVGITFVLYADAEAAAARVAREAETAQRADVDPQQALAFLLSQIIYDVNDATGFASGLRGHSLSRSMYGYNSLTPGLNISAYSGVGRVHTNGTAWPYMNPYGLDDNLLVNYTWFQGDNFARNPEWYGNLQLNPTIANASKGSPLPATGTFYVGGNSSYTYPDLNSFFLAAVRSDGTVLTPSFHRPWLFQVVGGKPYAFNDMTNPNWTLPQGKYLTLRPRPFEHPTFPAPDDAFGDVRNLPWSTTNDSIWIDPGGPVITAPDGTLYKMLVAPCIIDLDNRINVGTAGNIEGGGIAGRSNQGWFPSEVNLSQLWSNSTTAPNEWLNLLLGNPPGTLPATPSTGYYGKYGKSMAPGGVALPLPALGGVLFPNGSPAHMYSQADLDGNNETAGGVPTTGVVLPTVSTGNKVNPCFPAFPVGYGSGSALERTYHPAYYNVFKSSYYNATNDNIAFRASDMEGLLRPNNLATTVDAGSSALISNLLRLCPISLGGTVSTTPDITAPQRRNWITTVSSDLARPGLSPWIYNPADPSSVYLVSALTPSLPPVGTPNPFISFTTFAQRSAPAATPNPPLGSDYTAAWQSLTAALGRLDLNRPLPPYPHMSSGLTAASVPPNSRYDNGPGGAMAAKIQAQFMAATAARQQLAIDIYLRLLAVTGVAPPSSLATPTPADLAPRRWLAQLAANIVDYIDDDEVSTPFNFYIPTNPPFGLPALGTNSYQVTPTATDPNAIPVWPGPAPAGNPDVPTYWVFGTELPRLVINEALGEYAYNPNPPKDNQTVNVNVWVELYNPMPASGPATTPGTIAATAAANKTVFQPLDGTPEVLYQPAIGGGTTPYNPYQLVIANNNQTANSYSMWFDTAGGLNNNVLGTPQQIRYSTPPTAAAPNGTPAICSFLSGAGTVFTVATPTTAAYPITPAGGLPGQSYMLVGPSASGNAQPYNDANSDINAANVTAAGGTPGSVPWLQSPHMTYQVTTSSGYKWSMAIPPPPGSAAGTAPGSLPIADNASAGVVALLRRLANPHLPPNPFTAAGTLTNPALPPNPYVTVDFSPFTLNGYDGTKSPPAVLDPLPSVYGGPATMGKETPASFGKLQPYSGINSTQSTPMPPMGGVNRQTLGSQNVPLTNPFTWLVHLDRMLISPMELLHVSSFAPHLLTQRFIYPTTIGGAPSLQLIQQPYTYAPAGGLPGMAYFQHYAPWFDQTKRLYRFFEMVDTHTGAAGISPINGRVPGKININTLWDLPLGAPATTPPTPASPQIYQAIADPPQVVTNADNPNFTAVNVNTIFQSLLTTRTPGLAVAGSPPVLSAADKPFVGMAAGMAPPTMTDPQYPNGMGIQHTLLVDKMLTDATAAAANARVLQLPNALTSAAPNYLQGAHPYMQNELLTKIHNRLTTRSNVFAVFLTIGFFQVIPGQTAVGQPNVPQLGPEIGRSEGRQIRHRMFAIVDRTNLTLSILTPPYPVLYPIPFPAFAGVPNPTPPPPYIPITVPPGSPPLPFQVTFSTTSGTNPYTGASWTIGVGSTVVFEPGTDNEETVVLQAGTAPGQFTAVFYKSHAIGVPVVLRGNPGPWTIPYDPRLDPGVVLYFSIID